VIYACPRAVLSAGLAGETQHQLLRPIPRSPGIIPAVLTPDFSYRRAATVLSRNTTTIRHPGDDPPQFLAILARKLAGLAQSRWGRRAVPPAPPRRGRWWSRRSAPAAVPPAAVRRGQAPRREPRGGRRRATARFFRPMAACPGPTPRAFGQQTRRKAGAAPWMGQRSETKSVTVPPGGANDVGGGGGALPAVARRWWRRAAGSAGAVRGGTLRVAAGRSGAAGVQSPRAASPRGGGSDTSDRRGQSSFRSRQKGPRGTSPRRRVGREPLRPDEFSDETIRGRRIVQRRQFVCRRGVQPARAEQAERGADGCEATGDHGPPKTNSPRHPGPQRGVPSGGWIRRTSSTTTRPTASGSSRSKNAGPLAVNATKPAVEPAGWAGRRRR